MKLNRRQSFKLGLGGIAAGIAILANRQTAKTASPPLEERPALPPSDPAPWVIGDHTGDPPIFIYPSSPAYITYTNNSSTGAVTISSAYPTSTLSSGSTSPPSAYTLLTGISLETI